MAATPGEDTIEDVQGRGDGRRIAIDRVGVKDIRHPIRVGERDGGVQHTVATVGMYVNLPHDRKGTHMSRFVAILEANDAVITPASLRTLLAETQQRLNADAARIELAFPFFVRKTAPASGVTSHMDYQVTLTGDSDGDRDAVTLQIRVPVTTLCPCSRSISAYGAHNQRTHVTVAIHPRADIPIEELVEQVEAQASAELYALLKRSDEKHVTEQAYEHPKFVEDLVRDVAARLNDDPRVGRYSVSVENFESIHNHSAYARIERDVDGD